MGLPVSVLARGASASTVQAAGAVAAVFDELREVDALFSTYRPDSEVSRIASGELTLHDCHPVVRDVAHRCDLLRRQTQGLFDATTPEGSWDPSGLVKGWAAQRALHHLAEVPDLDWCLNAGGDVAVLSSSGRPFVVGIQDPRDDRRVAATASLTTGGVATSGTAARGAHLYDPRTGQPASPYWLSVTVTGPELEVADVLATAAFVAGPRWLDVVATGVGCAGLAIDAQGELHPSPGWPGTLDG
ncbi:MAG: ApbE family lipoprotein [Frankiales bacterium]|nr:ApbE family lipoprotein [Frankiales bacterium]